MEVFHHKFSALCGGFQIAKTHINTSGGYVQFVCYMDVPLQCCVESDEDHCSQESIWLSWLLTIGVKLDPTDASQVDVNLVG